MTAIEWQAAVSDSSHLTTSIGDGSQAEPFYVFFFSPPHLRHRVIPASDDLATIVDNCNVHPPTVREYPPKLNQKLKIAPHILLRLHNDCRPPRTRSCAAHHPRRTKAQAKTIALTSTHQQTTTPTRPDTPPFCWKRTRREQKRAPSHIYSVVKDIRYVPLDAPCARTRHR